MQHLEQTPLERTPSRGPSLAWAVASSLALFSLVGWRFAEASLEGGQSSSAARAARPVVDRPDLSAEERSNIDIYRRASPSVVNVTNLALLHNNRFSRDVTETPQGTGSGFVWDEEGHVVTNYHVIFQSDRVDVQAQHGDQVQGCSCSTTPFEIKGILGAIRSSEFLKTLAAKD